MRHRDTLREYFKDSLRTPTKIVSVARAARAGFDQYSSRTAVGLTAGLRRSDSVHKGLQIWESGVDMLGLPRKYCRILHWKLSGWIDPNDAVACF